MINDNRVIYKERAMPTIHFEYTDNLKIADGLKPFLNEVHNLLVQIIKTDLPTCRSLIACFDDYVVGDGNPDNAFIQLTIKMLPGRSSDVKRKLGNMLFERIQTTFEKEITRLKTQVRVYLQDTDIEHYYGLNQ